MEVKALHLENGVSVSDAIAKDLAKALQAFADWHKTPQVQIKRCDQLDLKAALQLALE